MRNQKPCRAQQEIGHGGAVGERKLASARPRANLERFYVEFGAMVRAVREDRGITQEQLAKKVRLTRTSIVNIEAGKQRILVHQLLMFSDALNVRAGVLIGRLR